MPKCLCVTLAPAYIESGVFRKRSDDHEIEGKCGNFRNICGNGSIVHHNGTGACSVQKGRCRAAPEPGSTLHRVRRLIRPLLPVRRVPEMARKDSSRRRTEHPGDRSRGALRISVHRAERSADKVRVLRLRPVTPNPLVEQELPRQSGWPWIPRFRGQAASRARYRRAECRRHSRGVWTRRHGVATAAYGRRAGCRYGTSFRH